METDTWDERDVTDTGGHSGTNSACNQANNENELNDAQDSPHTEQDTNQQNGGCSIDSCSQPSDIVQCSEGERVITPPRLEPGSTGC